MSSQLYDMNGIWSLAPSSVNEIDSANYGSRFPETLPSSILVPSLTPNSSSSEGSHVEEPVITIPEEVVCKVRDTPEYQAQFKVHNLLCTADKFIEVAHELANKVHKDKDNVMQYYSLIRAAIGCLLVAQRKYFQFLSQEKQAAIYLYLAQLYFHETRNVNLAEEAVNKAISISTRGNLVTLKFQAEFMATQILFVSNVKLGVKYLDSKLEEYSKDLYQSYPFVSLFEVLKLRFSIVLYPHYSMTVIERLSQLNNLTLQIRQLLLIHQIPLLLSRGEFDKVVELTEELDTYTASIPQLEAMSYIFKMTLAIRQEDFNLTKKYIVEMDNFIKLQKSKNWQIWNDDGSFVLDVYFQSESNIESTIPCRVDWLSSDDFLLLLYFTIGIAYLPRTFDGKGKSCKFFDVCLSLIDNGLSKLESHKTSLSFQQQEDSMLRFQFLQILICYYKLLARFNSGNWELHSTGEDEPIFTFIDKYDKGDYSSQELLVYHKLFPHILYLLGVFYHGLQDFERAKSYYTRIRSHLYKSSLDLPLESRFMTDPVLLSLYQMGVGIGADTQESRFVSSELYIFASLNMLAILSSELKNSTDEDEFFKKSNVRKSIVIDLDECQMGKIHASNSMLNITIQLLLLIFNNSSLSETKEVINSLNNVATLSSIMNCKDIMSGITVYYPAILSMLFYLSSHLDSSSLLQNLKDSYHYAKMSKNLKLLSLSSFHIYKFMEQNTDGLFSVEEIHDQKMKYLNYQEMFEINHEKMDVTNERSSDGITEDGQYDNEKNDDYYDRTAVDISSL